MKGFAEEPSLERVREDASGDSEDDELPCLIGESADGAHRTLQMINLVKFLWKFGD